VLNVPTHIVISNEFETVSARPLDWAMTFFRSYKWKLLWFAVPVIFVEWIFTAWFQASAITPKSIFLWVILSVLAKTWLFSTVAMFVASFLLNLPQDYRGALARGIRFLPKIFFSFLVVLFLVVFLMQGVFAGLSTAVFSGSQLALIPLLALLVLPLFFWSVFFWGPLFVVGETFTEPTSRKMEEEDYGMDDDDAESIPVTYFKDKAVWELGFMRSAWFTFFRPLLTLQTLLLLWVAVVIPRAFVSVFFLGGGPLAHYIEIAIVTVFDVWIFCVIAGVFFSALPMSMLQEMGVSWSTVPFDVSNPKEIRLQGRPIKLMLTGLVAVCATVLIALGVMKQQRVPDFVEFRPLEIQRQGEEIVISLEVSDSEKGFSWFVDPSRFVISSAPTIEALVEQFRPKINSGSQSVETRSAPQTDVDESEIAQAPRMSQQKESADLKPRDVLLEARNARVTTIDGRELHTAGSYLDETLIKLYLRFSAEPLSRLSPESQEQKLYLYFISPFESVGPLHVISMDDLSDTPSDTELKGQW
jgi:hypothetical protein